MRLKVGFGLGALVAVVFLTACGHGNLIGSSATPTPTPSPTGVSAEFLIPVSNAGPVGITLGSDDLLYNTDKTNAAVSAYSVTGNTFTSYVPKTKNSQPSGITEGPDGDIWFVETAGNNVATLVSGVVTEFALPAGAAPTAITPGPGSTLYITEPGLNAIGTISTTVEVAAGPYAIPTANANPSSIVAAPDNNVWFTEQNAAKIGRFNPLTKTVDMEVPLPAGSADPTTIVVGPDGALWFTENNPAAPKIGRLEPSTQSIVEYPLTGAHSALGLAVGIDNSFYFTDPANNAIGSFNPLNQKVAEYKIPTANSSPANMILGPDDKIYFVETAASKIGQFTYF